MIKVWHDWDSGPYETISLRKHHSIEQASSEMSEADYQDYLEVMRRYDEWQERLSKLRKERQ
jgi:hypothetical protein